jgi:hypothetical protein
MWSCSNNALGSSGCRFGGNVKIMDNTLHSIFKPLTCRSVHTNTKYYLYTRWGVNYTELNASIFQFFNRNSGLSATFHKFHTLFSSSQTWMRVYRKSQPQLHICLLISIFATASRLVLGTTKPPSQSMPVF